MSIYYPAGIGSFLPAEVIRENPLERKEKIPRPPNAFMMFAKEYRPILLNQSPNVENKVVSIKLGQMWKELSPEAKSKYFYLARQAERKHREMYPDYRYTPKKRQRTESETGGCAGHTVHRVACMSGTASGKALCTCSSSGRGSLSSKLEAISRTVCDPGPAYPTAYLNPNIAHQGYPMPPSQPYSYPAQFQQNYMQYPQNPQFVMYQNPTAFRRVSAQSQTPSQLGYTSMREFDPMMSTVNSADLNESSSLDTESELTLSQDSYSSQSQPVSSPIKMTSELPPLSNNQLVANPNDYLPPSKKIRLRNVNDPQKTIMVQPSTGANGNTYHIQALPCSTMTSDSKAAAYKNDVTYVKEENKTYTDISNNTVPSEEKEQSSEILDQWLSFFKSVVPADALTNTAPCPCVAFLPCHEEFAKKLGWDPKELVSYQDYVKNKLTNIVGEKGINAPCTVSTSINAPCTVSTTTVELESPESPDYVKQAPRVASKDIANCSEASSSSSSSNSSSCSTCSNDTSSSSDANSMNTFPPSFLSESSYDSTDHSISD